MKLLVTGAGGSLGAYLLRDLTTRSWQVTAWSGTQIGSLFAIPLHPVDLADPDAVTRAFAETRPDVVVHAAALAKVGDCCANPARARLVNVDGTRRLAELAAQHNARLLLVSTDLVFDGEHAPYREGDPPAPLSVYGRTKAEAEQAVLAYPGNAVVRLSLLFGPALTGRISFFDQQIEALRRRKPITLFDDEWRTPLALPIAASALVELVESSFTGLLHLGGPERLSRLEMGEKLARRLGSDPSLVVRIRRDSIPASEPRPRDVSLDSSRWRELFPDCPWPGYDEAVLEMFRWFGERGQS
jgi:dTDP-4-dehydrorhamnose reductase